MDSKPGAQHLVPAMPLTLLSPWANPFFSLGLNFPICPKKVLVRVSQPMALMTKYVSRPEFLLLIGMVGMGV